MRKSFTFQRGFTIIELLAVITIIALLATLATPGFQNMMERSYSLKCGSNLRQIGIAVNSYVSEHDNCYPLIETNPTNPVYSPDDHAQGMLDTLQPYGVTLDVLTCPKDKAGVNHVAKLKTSYEWRPILDGETQNAPKVYWRATPAQVSATRIRIVTDFERYHFGRMNALYGDGHVTQVMK